MIGNLFSLPDFPNGYLWPQLLCIYLSCTRFSNLCKNSSSSNNNRIQPVALCLWPNRVFYHHRPWFLVVVSVPRHSVFLGPHAYCFLGPSSPLGFLFPESPDNFVPHHPQVLCVWCDYSPLSVHPSPSLCLLCLDAQLSRLKALSSNALIFLCL